jgi:hypothetical protein
VGTVTRVWWCLGCEVLTAVNITITVLWDVMPCAGVRWSSAMKMQAQALQKCLYLSTILYSFTYQNSTVLRFDDVFKKCFFLIRVTVAVLLGRVFLSNISWTHFILQSVSQKVMAYFHLHGILKKAGSYQVLVPVYSSTLHHIPEVCSDSLVSIYCSFCMLETRDIFQ